MFILFGPKLVTSDKNKEALSLTSTRFKFHFFAGVIGCGSGTTSILPVVDRKKLMDEPSP